MILDEAASVLVQVLFPQFAEVVVERLQATAQRVRFEVTACSTVARCPTCGVGSDRVHSRYERVLADRAVGQRPVLVRARVRRFRCGNNECPQRIFCEQVGGLTQRYQRRTPSARILLADTAMALGGRAGARLSSRLASEVSPTTMLRVLRTVPLPEVGELVEVGVDDFALRRGHHYGTVLVDLRTHRPIDLLPDRTADTLAAWLVRHPTVRVVCRDRAGAYADGAARGAPQALQVADRWHIWANLGQAVERVVAGHRAALRPPEPPRAAMSSGPLPAVTPPAPADRRDRTAVRTRDRYQQIHQMLDQGVGIRSIAAKLNLARGTVRRFARAGTVEELLVNNRTGYRSSPLEPYKPYLHQRWQAGVTNATTLHAEITARGFTGGTTVVRAYIRRLRATPGAVPPPAPAPPTVRQAAAWLMTNPDHLDTTTAQRLAGILDRSPTITTLAEQVRRFADMITQLSGHQLTEWITAARRTGIPELRSFVAGLERDYDAVHNGLTMPHSSGAVEGHVNRIKMLKRQMFGRANLDLLRIRVLHRT